eukprot:jgi/Chlat1/7518/Chrsp61S00551
MAPVPESVLKKRRRDEEWSAKRVEAAQAKAAAAKASRRDVFKRAEAYVKEYRTKEAEEVRLRREAKVSGAFYVPPEAPLAVVIRIRGINDMHPTTKKIMQLLRLRQIQNAVFVRVNAATMAMLKRVEPYVAYG